MLRSLYLSCVRPTLDYATCAWGPGVVAQDALRLECSQRAAARVITGSSLKDKLPADLLLARAGLEFLFLLRKVDLCYTISSCSKGSAASWGCVSAMDPGWAFLSVRDAVAFGW